MSDDPPGQGELVGDKVEALALEHQWSDSSGRRAYSEQPAGDAVRLGVATGASGETDITVTLADALAQSFKVKVR